MGKALGGGMLPIAAAICHSDHDVAGAFAIGHYTHEKNPITARAALTTINIVEEEGLVENAARVGAFALERLNDMKSRHSLIGDVRGRGLLLGVDLVVDRDSKEPAKDAAEAIYYHALEGGLSFKLTMGNVISLSPPLVITEKEMHKALDIIEDALADVEKEGVQ